MSFEPREYLRHIHAEADYLATASVGLTREKYRDDPTLQRAFARSLEIIGEAAKKVPPEMRMQHLDSCALRWDESWPANSRSLAIVASRLTAGGDR